MPIVIAPILVAFLLLITVLVAYALLHQIVVWLRPLLGYLLANHSSFWKRVLLYPVRTVAHGILRVEHAVANALSHAAAASLPQAARFFGGQALVVEELALHLSGWATASYQALYTLRHTTVPRLISDAVTPVRRLAVQARALAIDAEGRLDDLRDGFGAALAQLGIGSWATLTAQATGLAHFTWRLYDKVWNDVVPRLQRVVAVDIPDLWGEIGLVTRDLYGTGIDSLGGIRTRLRDLEGLLGRTIGGLDATLLALIGSVAGVAAIEAVLVKIAPNLFCRNTKNVTSKLCGLDEGLIESLLAGTLGLLVVLDVQQIARAAQAATGELDGQIRQMAGV